jgi:hypothetical protein
MDWATFWPIIIIIIIIIFTYASGHPARGLQNELKFIFEVLISKTSDQCSHVSKVCSQMPFQQKLSTWDLSQFLNRFSNDHCSM